MKNKKIGRPKGSKNKKKLLDATKQEFEKTLDDYKPIKRTVTVYFGGWHIEGTGNLSDLHQLLTQLEE